MSESSDVENDALPGHRDVSCDLGTPRQYTARGGWNIDCECGETVGETGDEDFQDRWLAHLTRVISSASATPAPTTGEA